MFRNNKLIIYLPVVAVIAIGTLIYWMRGNSTESSDVVVHPQQLSSNSEKPVSKPPSTATNLEVSLEYPVVSSQEVSRQNYDDVHMRAIEQWDNQYNSKTSNRKSTRLVGWRPSTKRNVPPVTAGKINQIITNAVDLLGYEKIHSVKLRKTYSTTEDRYSDYHLPKTMTSYELYNRPGWMRRDIYEGEHEQPLMIEVITDELIVQKKAGGDPIKDTSVLKIPWYNYSNHPLMLHHELNPLIYESLELKQLSAEDAITIEAKEAVGHLIAILKTPRDTTEAAFKPPYAMKGHEFLCETWVDTETGRVLRNIMYDRDKVISQTYNYVYKEVAEKVFFPVARKTVFYRPDGNTVVEEKTVDIQINTSIDTESPLLWQRWE